jgi:hypothetical protein
MPSRLTELQTGEKQCCLTETQNLATDAQHETAMTGLYVGLVGAVHRQWKVEPVCAPLARHSAANRTGAVPVMVTTAFTSPSGGTAAICSPGQ